MTDDIEDEFYLRRLDAGLFTLQLVDYVMLEVCATGSTSVSKYVFCIPWECRGREISLFCLVSIGDVYPYLT